MIRAATRLLTIGNRKTVRGWATEYRMLRNVGGRLYGYSIFIATVRLETDRPGVAKRLREARQKLRDKIARIEGNREIT